MKDLKISPDPVAAAAFNYWLATFETFLRTAEVDQATTNPGVEVKKGLLADFLSHVVYSYVEDCEMYDEALVVLKRVHVK